MASMLDARYGANAAYGPRGGGSPLMGGAPIWGPQNNTPWDGRGTSMQWGVDTASRPVSSYLSSPYGPTASGSTKALNITQQALGPEWWSAAGNPFETPGSKFAPYNTPNDQGALDMIRATGQSVLANNYFQTPGYQLLFGSDWKQMDPRLSPAQRFEASPGYQWMQDESMRNIQRNAASQGLLESGDTMRDMLRQSQGLAQQDYYNWWGNLSGNYENYQNRLAALASAGMGNTGNDMAFNLGQSQGNTGMQSGANLANLYANQGSAGLGATLNTGAGMSGNVMQGLQVQAQIDAANAAAKNQASQSSAAGIGQIAGQAMGMLGGLF